MAVKWDRTVLQKAAGEMNEVMSLTPAIDTEMLDDETLFDVIKQNALGMNSNAEVVPADAIRSTDKFSKEAWGFFAQAGIWNETDQAIIVPKAAGVAEEPEAEAEMEPEPKKVTKKAAPAKAAEKGKGKEVKSMTRKDAKAAAPKKGKTAPAKKAAPAKEKKERDVFGFRVGSFSSQAMKLFTTGKYTMHEAMEKLNSKTDYKYALGRAKEYGAKVKVSDEGKITVSPK